MPRLRIAKIIEPNGGIINNICLTHSEKCTYGLAIHKFFEAVLDLPNRVILDKDDPLIVQAIIGLDFTKLGNHSIDEIHKQLKTVTSKKDCLSYQRIVRLSKVGVIKEVHTNDLLQLKISVDYKKLYELTGYECVAGRAF